MAVKYTIPYRSIDDTPWRVDISTAAWTDPAITVRGYGGNACTIELDGGVDDPFDNPVVSSKANIQLINQGELDMDELQEAGDRDFVVEVYRDNVLKWKGYLITDNIQQPLMSTPYMVQLSAIDGLNMLEGITYNHNNLQTQPIDIAVRAPLNFLRQILFSPTNLGLMLPIRWYIDLENVATEDDPLAGLMPWSPYGEGLQAGQYEDEFGYVTPIYQNCRYILEGLVKCMKGARIFQSDGAWNIFPPIDIIGGEFTYKECEATLGLPTITTQTVDINRLVNGSKEPGGDYSYIREDALITVKPALSKVDVIYDHDQRENILPNGGFDSWTIGGLPMYWNYIINSESLGTIEQYRSLTDRPGNSVLLTLPPTATTQAQFGLGSVSNIQGVPIDANLLFKRITWGFSFMPTMYGFPTDEDETIIWDTNPLAVGMRYTIPFEGGERVYFLNEFGYWQFEARGTDLGVQYINRESTLIGGNTWDHQLIFEGSPNVGDKLSIYIRNQGGGPFIEYSFEVTGAEEGNLEAALDGLTDVLEAQNTRINVQPVQMDSADRGRVRFLDLIQYGYPYGQTSKSGSTQQFRWIYPHVDQLKTYDVASFVFQGKGGNSEILMPDPGYLDQEVNPIIGKLDVRFWVSPGQRYAIDDLWVRVEDNKDVYRAETSSEGKTQQITLGISSSFSGFMVSNMMRSFNTSNEDFRYTDGTIEASLTEHYARAVMRWRYAPSKIFNGTISTRTEDWSFFEIYQFSGLSGNYLPLNARYNTELCEVNLIAMEGRDDGEITDVKHFGSNNMPLSNYGG